MEEKALIVIPARMGSSRFPRKPLAQICGLSMLERVWRIGCAVKQADEVVIATENQEIKTFAEGFGAKVVMTSEQCPTGTDRVGEAAQLLGYSFPLVFSLQGDAVLTPPGVVDEVLSVMRQEKEAMIATPAVRLEGAALKDFVESKRNGSTTGTSVVMDRRGYALYFSKALIPATRERDQEHTAYYRHIGLYGYRSETLKKLLTLEQTPLERAEKLEQLRALENGIAIRVVAVDYRGRTHASVDRPEDVAVVEALIKKEGELL